MNRNELILLKIVAISKYRHTIRRTRHPLGTVQRTARHEERPPAQPLTQLRQTVQIEHLPDRHAPTRKHMLMQVPLGLQRGEHLEADRVRRHGREVVIPEESEHPLTLLQTGVFRFAALLAVGLLLGVGHRVPCLRESDTEEEDVPALKLDVAFLGDGEDVVEGNGVLGKCVRYGLSFLFQE